MNGMMIMVSYGVIRRHLSEKLCGIELNSLRLKFVNSFVDYIYFQNQTIKRVQFVMLSKDCDQELFTL